MINFVTSGLMGNQISLLIHNDPGTEVITPHDSHIKNYEHGAAAFLSRVQFRDAEHTDGELNLEYVEKLILKSKVHKPIIKTVSIENTHLASGGSIVPFDSIETLSKVVREHGLKTDTYQGVRPSKNPFLKVPLSVANPQPP